MSTPLSPGSTNDELEPRSVNPVINCQQVSTGKIPDLPIDLRDTSVRVAVLSDAAPDRNGVGSYYADLVEQLHNRVGEAVLLHPDCQLSPGYRYLSAPLPGDRTQRVSVPRPARLWRAIKRTRPTVIIVPTPGPFGLSGLYLSRKLGVPLIVGFHTNYEALATLYWQNLFGHFCQRFLNWCNSLLFRNSKLVLANSPDMLRQAIAGGAHTAKLMGTSVPGEFINTPVKATNKTVQRVLFAGRLADEKNLPQVIEAVVKLPDLQFTIAGDGPLRSMVECAAEDLPNLDFCGWVSRNELLDLMDSHDVLLLPSKVESFGTVALEGMARARLVIVTESCGIAEWSELSEALFIVGQNEHPWQTLDRVCSLDLGERHSIGVMAREQAVNLNSWNISSWVNRLQNAQSQSAQ